MWHLYSTFITFSVIHCELKLCFLFLLPLTHPPLPPYLQVDAGFHILQPDPIPVIKYMIIPLDTSNCESSAEESQDPSSSNGVLEVTAAILTLISLLLFATGMV